MARRLNSKKCILTGILLGTYIYLFGVSFTGRHSRGQQTDRNIDPLDSITVRPDAQANLDDVENVMHSFKKEEVNQNAPEKKDGPFENIDIIMQQNNRPNCVVADEVNRAVVELISSVASALTESGKKEIEKSSASSTGIGIKEFPTMIATPLENDDNKTLKFLDLWNYDEKCARFQVGLLKDNSLERRALVSFPGSGNSWLRMLLQGVSGVFIDSVYSEGGDNLFHSKANSTYQIPIDCGCTLLQKTHDFSLDAKLFYLPEANRTQTLNEFEGKGILILRNPFASIRSYRNFNSGGMQGLAPDAAFQGQKWDNFVSRSVASWETLAHVWIRGLKQGGIIYYEKLRHEMPSELARLSKILGLSYNQERLDCVLRHSKDNSFKRSSINKTVQDPYTASQRLLIHKAIEGVQAALKERGLDPLPTQYYEFFSLLPEYGISSNTTRK